MQNLALPAPELTALRTAWEDALAQLRPVANQEPARAARLGELGAALHQLGVLLQRLESEPQTREPQTLSDLADYGISLCEALAEEARRWGMVEVQRTWLLLPLPYAVALGRWGAPVQTLAPVVNALALAANATQTPETLATLYAWASTLVAATPPSIRADLEALDPARPWRVLLLNRAILATRTHDPEAMQAAFADLLRCLPQDALAFFQEGMRQMRSIPYPESVRATMALYLEQAQAAPLTKH